MKLREKNTAQLKLSILEKTVKLIGEKSFKDLYVNEICEAVGTSKVSLFSYFPKKEDILVYYMRIWCLHRMAEQLKDPKRGVEAIHNLFMNVADEIQEKPGLMLSLIAFMANSKLPPSPIQISRVERQILYPENDELLSVEIPSIQKMFLQHTREAIEDNELDNSIDENDLVEMLTTIFYGVPLVLHINLKKNLHNAFMRHLQSLFNPYTLE